MADASKDSVKFTKYDPRYEEAHVDFLMCAHKDRFNSLRYVDRDSIKRFYRWEYTDNPCRIEGKPLIWLCWKGDSIIAQVCVMPADLSCGGRRLKAGWVQDLIVLAEHRNTGIGYFLLKHAVDELAAYCDVAMVGGTNPDSYALCKAAGFGDTGFFNRNIYPVNFDRIAARLSGSKTMRSCIGAGLRSAFKLKNMFSVVGETAGCSMIKLDSFDNRFDQLWAETSSENINVTARDREALEWRFIKRPRFSYTILACISSGKMEGYVVLRDDTVKTGRLSGLKIGIISDILFTPVKPAIGDALLLAAIDHFSSSSSIVRCDIFSDLAGPAARRTGFINTGSNNRLLIKPLKDTFPASATKESWHLTYADSDLDLS